MRQLVAALVGAVVLGAAGFATASAVQVAKKPGAGGESTTGMTGTGTGVTGTTSSHKVVICHRTGSTRNPGRTITVDEHAEPAHLAHGDKLGACPTQPTVAQAAVATSSKGKAKTNGSKSKQKSKQKPKPKPKGNTSHGKTGGSPAAPANPGGQSSSAGGQGNSGGRGNSGDQGKPANPGNSGDHGNSGGHGRGK
jgi:hypothetical protein